MWDEVVAASESEERVEHSNSLASKQGGCGGGARVREARETIG